jgi:hypothetical protein
MAGHFLEGGVVLPWTTDGGTLSRNVVMGRVWLIAVNLSNALSVKYP